jgi:hypothetical protein
MLFAIDHMLQLLLLFCIESDQFLHFEYLFNILLADDRVESKCRIVVHHFLAFYAFSFVSVVIFEELI